VQSLWSEVPASTFVYEFDHSRIVVGRSRSADVQLPHAAVSSTHASIRHQGMGFALIDEGSTNGTRVNETRIAAGRPKPLQTHDVIDLGGYRLTVELMVPVAESTPAKRTSEYARRMLAEQQPDADDEALEAKLAAVQLEADESVPLLPIPKDARPTPAPSRPSTPVPAAPTVERPSMATSELLVYSLAGLLLAGSVVVMFLLTRP